MTKSGKRVKFTLKHHIWYFLVFLPRELHEDIIKLRENLSEKDTLKYYVLTLEKQLDPIKSDQLTDDDQQGAWLFSIRISFSSSNFNRVYRAEK